MVNPQEKVWWQPEALCYIFKVKFNKKKNVSWLWKLPNKQKQK